MRIRFTRDVWLNKDDRAKKPSFPEGSSHDMNKASAYRWVRRNVAVYIVEEVVAVEPPKLKMNRPMMASSEEIRKEVLEPAWAKNRLEGSHKDREEAAKADKPKKRGRPPKPKQDTTVREIKTGPDLPVKGSSTNGGPGWDGV